MHYFIPLESGPVASLRAKSTSDASRLNVIWTPPDRPNGEILHYRIEIYEVSTDCRDKIMMHGPPVQTDRDASSQVLEDLGKLL